MKWLPSCLILACLPLSTVGQTTPVQPSPAPARNVPLKEKLASPRETVKTLYFSVIAFDFRPQLIEDAIACLELDPARQRQTSEAALLALQMEEVLKGLNLPLNALPEHPELNRVVIYDADSFHIGMHRTDEQWRFDRETLDRLPLMHRQTLLRQKSQSAETAGLREPYTDPRATMRRFLSDVLANDFYTASQALDLSSLSPEQRTETGTLLAQQLAYVIQRRGWVFQQEIPNNPNGSPYSWYADQDGRIFLERVGLPDGKDAWLFSRKTLRNLPQMYEQVKAKEPDIHYVWLGKLVPAVSAVSGAAKKRPETVPARLSTPRAMLKGFYAAMTDAQSRDSRCSEVLDFLDLRSIAPTDRKEMGIMLADKIETILRKLHPDLSSIPDDWNSPPQTLGQDQNLRIEIARQRDGCWRFSQATVSQVPALYEKLSARDRADRDRGNHLESARGCMISFLEAINRYDNELAAHCLDLSDIHPGAQSELGPVLAFKLKYVMDRLGRVYPEEIPDEPEGPHFVFHRSELGRIVIARTTEGSRKGDWLFTAETVTRIERMFRKMLPQPPDEAVRGMKGIVFEPTFLGAPGIWLRLRLPAWAQLRAAGLEIYQWIGLVLAVLIAGVTSKLLLSQVYRMVSWLLHRTGSVLSQQYIGQKLRPLTWALACWLLFDLLSYLDLSVAVINTVLPLKKFVMATLIGWLGFQLIDLCTGIYINSELLRPHRNLSDMIVPVTMRLLKGLVLLMVLIYVIYQIGQGDSLGRFLTGLGVAGLAASLAAQDILKSFFGTLLLIGERSFKLGDRIVVDGKEGVVEQVGFRSTRLRTADGALVSVPNSMIASGAVNNMGARSARRFQTAVLLGSDTAVEKTLALRDHLQGWLSSHPQVAREQLEVALERLTDQGVKLVLRVHLKVAEAAEEKRVHDEINREVVGQAEKLGIDLSGGQKTAPADTARPGYVLNPEAA